MHKRFKRKVLALKSDFTSSLAKCLIKQSPYVVPDNLSICIEKFDDLIFEKFLFDTNDIVEINLIDLTATISALLEKIPEVMALSECKNTRGDCGFAIRRIAELNPDDDFIDITAVAQNITCDFADAADVLCWLEQKVK